VFDGISIDANSEEGAFSMPSSSAATVVAKRNIKQKNRSEGDPQICPFMPDLKTVLGQRDARSIEPQSNLATTGLSVP